MNTPEIINRLRRLEKQGEDYIWRVAKEAADEIERLTTDQPAWLIERRDPPHMYWCGFAKGLDGSLVSRWEHRWDTAIRFSRRTDAEKVAIVLEERNDTRIAQHSWDMEIVREQT